MNHHGDLLGKPFLKKSFMRSFVMLRNDIFNLLLTQNGKDFNIFSRIFIRNIKPELVKLVRGSFFRIEPYISRFCFTKFSSIRFCYQRAGKGIGFTSCFSADKLCTSYNIPPLIRTTHLKLTVEVIE